jgi:glycosyltransferase involved in cell wall biosynthesis
MQEAALFALSLQLHARVFDLAIIEYLYFHWTASLFPARTSLVLHAHELLSRRTAEFARCGRSVLIPITQEEERRILSQFERVVFAQCEEAEIAAGWIGKERCLVCPHPVAQETPIAVKDTVSAIRFLGSSAWPNVDGLLWFHDRVVPLLGKLQERCAVQGTITLLSGVEKRCPQLRFEGVTPDLSATYRATDIAVNPVLYGSGLKIKTVEALGYGVPLVTTSVGAQGISQQAGVSFLTGDTPESFADALCQLAHSQEKRQALSSSAHTYCLSHFTPEACFGALLA